MNSQATLVHIVDDDADLREALALLMRSVDLDPVCHASGRDFLAGLDPRRPACVVLDVRMPGLSGLEVQGELRKRRIDWPVVLLTGHADVPLAVSAMKAGAVDVIQKPLEEHRLVLAVLNALRRVSAAGGPAAPADPRLEALSRREHEVLQQILDGRTNREIADLLAISLKTVEFHRANIRDKLGVGSLPELFRLFYGPPR